jgi:hypothetical protein
MYAAAAGNMPPQATFKSNSGSKQDKEGDVNANHALVCEHNRKRKYKIGSNPG